MPGGVPGGAGGCCYKLIGTLLYEGILAVSFFI